jgi:hypothetical protein
LQERTWSALFDAALGIGVNNARYRKDAEITEFTASRDLKKLCEVELLTPHGERKMRTYTASKILSDVRGAIRMKRSVDDPYALAERRRKIAMVEAAMKETPRLPGL